MTTTAHHTKTATKKEKEKLGSLAVPVVVGAAERVVDAASHSAYLPVTTYLLSPAHCPCPLPLPRSTLSLFLEPHLHHDGHIRRWLKLVDERDRDGCSRAPASIVEYPQPQHERTCCDTYSAQSPGKDGRCAYPLAALPTAQFPRNSLAHHASHPQFSPDLYANFIPTHPSLQLVNRSRDNAANTVDATVNGFRRMNLADRPSLPLAAASTPGMGGQGVATRRLGRPGLKLSDIEGMASGAKAAGLARGRPSAPSALPLPRRPPPAGEDGTPFANFSKIVCVPSTQPRTSLYSFPLSRDPSGALRFTDKAVLHAKGVNFGSGASFSINMSEFDLQDELGKGFYGTVRKVLHKPTNVLMAMKVSFRSPPSISQPP